MRRPWATTDCCAVEENSILLHTPTHKSRSHCDHTIWLCNTNTPPTCSCLCISPILLCTSVTPYEHALNKHVLVQSNVCELKHNVLLFVKYRYDLPWKLCFVYIYIYIYIYIYTWCGLTHQMQISMNDEKRDGSRIVCLLTVQPPDAACTLRKIYWTESPWKLVLQMNTTPGMLNWHRNCRLLPDSRQWIISWMKYQRITFGVLFILKYEIR
jgi:hypothetical protein